MNEQYPVPDTAADDPEPTMLSCPSCAGVLALHSEKGREHFRCGIGHQFSIESLFEAKEEELEQDLWSAVALLAHIEMISAKLCDRLDSGEPGPRRDGLQGRVVQSRSHAERLRALLEETVRPNLRPIMP